MFPIIDVRGNVIAFGGRIMNDQKPKYLNTSDTPVFKKSANLFSLNNAKKTADRTLILCEGYMDVISVNQAGFENAVATLGTALTTEQAVLMKRFADQVIICYDADEAGQKATQRAIDILRKAGLNIRVLTVPDGKDPDEFIKKHGENGAAAFYNLVNGSSNDTEYRLSKVRAKYDLKIPSQRVQYLDEAVKVLSSIDDGIEQDVYASRLAEETGVQRETIMTELKRHNSQRRRSYQKKEFRKFQTALTGQDDKINTQHKDEPRATRAEEMLISHLINHPDLGPYISSKIAVGEFVTDFNRKLFQYVIEKINMGYEPLNTINQDFTQDEISKIYGIIQRTIKVNPTQPMIDEYINIILEEKHKMKKEDIANASVEEINDYIKKLREKKE